MITDEILQYASEVLRDRILKCVLVKKITVWGRTVNSPFVSIRIDLLPLPHEMQYPGHGGDEHVSIPGEIIGPLDEDSTKRMLRWAIDDMAARVRRRASRFEPQPGTIEVVPLEQMDRLSEPNGSEDE